jgi:hypothetical protein
MQVGFDISFGPILATLGDTESLTDSCGCWRKASFDYNLGAKVLISEADK